LISIAWDNVATSAVTALVVLLSVDYFIKPRTEVRKDLIVEAHRARREFVAAITTISLAAGVVAEEIPEGAPLDIQKSVRAEQDRQYERMRSSILDLFDNFPKYGVTFRAMNHRMLVDYISTAHGALLSKRTQQQQGRLIRDLGVPMGMLMATSLWRLPRSVKALFELRLLVNESREIAEPSGEASPALES
jgi:hypothetical protein